LSLPNNKRKRKTSITANPNLPIPILFPPIPAREKRAKRERVGFSQRGCIREGRWVKV
jgi:hypothetical protein